ncbi:MAG: hypothetical protein QM761_14235 [Pseudoxanthomonas sp.]
MHWLFLAVAVGALLVSFTVKSMALLALCLLVSLAAFLAWAMGLYAARVGARNDAAQMIDPAELHRLRALAAARKTADAEAADADRNA